MLGTMGTGIRYLHFKQPPALLAREGAKAPEAANEEASREQDGGAGHD